MIIKESMTPQNNENTVPLNLVSKHYLIFELFGERKSRSEFIIILLCLENSDKCVLAKIKFKHMSMSTGAAVMCQTSLVQFGTT